MNCQDFFRALYGETLPDGLHILLWTLPDKINIVARDTSIAEDQATEWSSREQNVYFHTALSNSLLRLKAADARAIPGVWADIDLAERKGNAKASGKEYAPNVQTVRQLFKELGLEPTIVLDTGGGLHVYWLLRELWLLPEHRDRQDAAVLVKGWGDTLRRLWSKHGYAIDSVGDLARVMRPPGTINHGRDGHVVYMIESDLERRYSVEELREHMWGGFSDVALASAGRQALSTVAETLPVVATPVGSGWQSVDVELPSADATADHAHRLARDDAKFRKTWDKKRVDLADQSSSSYDQALANEAVYREWSNQQIAAAIVVRRRLCGEDLTKPLQRLDYLQRTIHAARTAHEPVATVQAIEEAGEPQTKEAALEAVSRICGLRIEACVRWQVQPRPEYLLVIGQEDTRRHVPIGTAAQVLNVSHAKGILYDQGIELRCTARQWAVATRLLLAVVEDLDEPDDTLERLLPEYLEGAQVMDRDDWRAAAAICMPHMRDGYLFVHVDHMFAWARLRKEPLLKRELWRLFRDNGWTRETVNISHSTRSYRRRVIDDLSVQIRSVLEK